MVVRGRDGIVLVNGRSCGRIISRNHELVRVSMTINLIPIVIIITFFIFIRSTIVAAVDLSIAAVDHGHVAAPLFIWAAVEKPQVEVADIVATIAGGLGVAL